MAFCSTVFTKVHRIIPALVFGAALVSCAPFSPGNPKAEVVTPESFTKTELPLLPVPLFPVIEVSINGTPGYRFLVDSGATPTGIFHHAGTAHLDLYKGRKFSIGGTGNGPAAKAAVAKDIDVTIGDIAFQGLTLVVLPADILPVAGDFDDFPLDGVIGYDLFRRFPVTIDSAAENIIIHASGADITPSTDAVSFPLKEKRGQFYTDLPIKASADAPLFQANLHLDTGMNGYLILEIASHPSIILPESFRKTVVSGIQGASENKIAIGPQFIIGDGILTGFLSVFENGGANFGKHGRVGHALLKRFAYTVDYPNRRLILQPRANSFETPQQGVIGIRGIPHEGGILVSNISAETPAAKAGFTPGIYDSVNGRNFSEMTWAEVDQSLMTEPGDKLVIRKRADPKPDCRTLIAADVAAPPSN